MNEKPPPTPRLGAVIKWLCVAVIAFFSGVAAAPLISSAVQAVGAYGDEPQGDPNQWYTCGMHPRVKLPNPGDCSICHMKLTPIDPAKLDAQLKIDPVMTQNIAVRIAPVVIGPLQRTIRTVATVDYDETAVRDVNIKVEGWIEKLHVDYLGAKVERGDVLFDFYSPDLFAAQEEYLLAFKNKDLIAAEFVPDARRGALDLLEAARTRLKFYDITDEQIDALQKAGKPGKTMAIRSPHTGVVIAKHANEGMNVDLGMRVYRIADLSKVWAMVTLYEYQLPYVQTGQRAVMTLPYVPGQAFEGKVNYIYPYLDSKTRQVKVRLEFDNPNRLLKPGMYVDVELQSTLADQRTLAPRAAIIDTGRRQVAFVSLGKGKFEPRPVSMGIEAADGMVEVLDGLKPGELVVTSGQFLLDSEAKFREALAKMVKGELAGEQVAVAAGTVSELAELSDDAAMQIVKVLDGYFAVGDALAADTTVGLDAPARQIAGAMQQLLAVTIARDPHFWHRHEEAATVRGKALELIGVSDLVDARLKYADLSIALSKLTFATGVPASYRRPVLELRCPMYREGQGGGIWLQPQGSVRNPFFGKSMLGCMDRSKSLPVTGPPANDADKE